jgi:hypothetical protein
LGYFFTNSSGHPGSNLGIGDNNYVYIHDNLSTYNIYVTRPVSHLHANGLEVMYISTVPGCEVMCQGIKLLIGIQWSDIFNVKITARYMIK